MPAIVKKTVMASGGDYSSLAAWEAGEQRDLVALDQIAVAECHAFLDNTRCKIGGWVSSPTNYIRVYAAQEHGGKWTDAAYRLAVPAQSPEGAHGALECYAAGIRIEGIQVENNRTGSGDYNYGIKIQGGDGTSQYFPDIDARVERCIVRRDPSLASSSSNSGIALISNHNVLAASNIVYGFKRGVYVQHDRAGFTAAVYNNTVEAGTVAGFSFQNAQTLYVRNNISHGGTPSSGHYFFAQNPIISAYARNISADATAPGADAVKNATPIFKDALNRDYHLDATDTVAVGKAVDLSADAYRPIRLDVDGQLRTAPWDVGADQHVTQTAGGFDTPVVTSGPQGVQLSVAKMRDNTTGTVRVRVSDPNGKVADVEFVAAERSAVDGSIIRKGPFPPDRTPPAYGAHEKDLLLDATRDTEVTTVATLTDGTTFEAAAQALGPRLDSGSVVVRGENLTQEVRVSGLVFAGGTVEFDAEHNTATVRFPSGGGTTDAYTRAEADARYVQLSGGTISTGTLNFGAQVRQMLNLWNAQYGIGVQGYTWYARSDKNFAFFVGGSHSDTEGDPGSGGVEMFRIVGPGTGNPEGVNLKRGWLRFDTGAANGLYWQSGPGMGYYIYPASQQDMRFRTATASGGIVGTVADETPRGYVHWTTGNEIGFLDHTRNWTLACSASWVRPLKPLYLGDMGQTGWGTMIVQGRVLSANNNIHLSPPDGTDVIIDTNYRQAGGAGRGVAGLRATGDIQARAFYLYSGERLATVIVRASTPTSSDAAPVGTLWRVV